MQNWPDSRLSRTVHRRAALFAAAALVLFCTPLRAQTTGTIIGRVTAAENGTPIRGATVTLVGSARGAITNAEGGYTLGALPAGDYRVQVAALGREPRTASVRLEPGFTHHLYFTLAEGSVLLPGIVVSATRAPESARQVASTVHVLGSQDVRRTPARTPDDLLRELPGVELPRTSGTVAGPEQIVSIRGTDEGRTLVLHDGIPLNDAWGEWIDWARAPVASLERVEVTEGGGSSLYGNYAMGGMIHLVSRPITPRTARATLATGSRSLRELSLLGADVRGPWAFQLEGSYADGGGYVLVPESSRGAIDTGHRSTRRNASLRTEYALGAGRTLSFRAGILDEDRSGGTPLTPVSRTIGGAALALELGDVARGHLSANLFGNVERQESHQSRTAPNRVSETRAQLQTIPSHDLGGSLQWARTGDVLALLAVGGDFRSMVGRLDEEIYNAAGALARTATSGGSQLIGGLFLQGVLAPAEPLRVEASVRVDGWRNFGGSRTVSDSARADFAERSDLALSPRLGLRFAALPGLTLRGSLFRAFRAPTLSEQYRNWLSGNVTFTGNPDLGPEHLTGGDFGLDWQPAPRLELRVTAFANAMRDLANFVDLQPGVRIRQNVGKATSRGVEGELLLRPFDRLRLAASYNYDDAKTEAGTKIARVPLHRVIGRATAGDEATGELSVIYRHEGTMNTLSGVALAPYDVLDLDVRRAVLGRATLFVSVENVTDARYLVNKSGVLDQLGLPRTIRGGLSVAGW